MLPLRLELRNFLAYQAPTTVRFEGIHLACLTGANGAGKSSILDAITWALWGKARAAREEELIHHGQADMSVQLDFEQDGNIYRVTRRRTRKSGGQGQLDLYVQEEDGTFRTMTEPGKKQTQDKIVRLLRMSYDMFVHSAFLQQGKADSFTTLNPAERKRVLGEILELDRWSAYEEAVKEQVSAIKMELGSLETRIADADRELEREPFLQRELETAQAAHAEAHAALQDAQARAAELGHVARELNAKKEEMAHVAKVINDGERDVASLNASVARQEADIAAHEEVASNGDAIEAGYLQLTRAREADQDLGEKLMQVSALDSKRSSLKAELELEGGKLRQEISALNARIAECDKVIRDADSAEYAQLQSEVQQRMSDESEREKAEARRLEMEQERSVRISDNNSLMTTMKALRARMDRLQAVDDPTCPLCGQPLTVEHKASVLGEWESEGKGQRKTLDENRTRIDELDGELQQVKARIESLNDAIRKGHLAEQRQAVHQEKQRRAEIAAEERTRLLADRDTLQITLDRDRYGDELRQQLVELDLQRTALDYDDGQHKEVRAALRKLAQYDADHQRLQVALQSLPAARAYLVDLIARRDSQFEQLTQQRTRLQTLTLECDALQAQAIEFRQREQEAERCREAERKANNIVITARQELKSLDTLRTRRTGWDAERDSLREQRGLYDELRGAFGKNGIPAMIIETVLPELETIANGLLGSMTDGRMSLHLATQVEKVTGGAQETLKLEIMDELGTRPYELYSGGEAFRINFALRVALSQLLARRAGAQLRTLFLDEGFGTQDDDGRAKLVDAITRVQDQFDLILVITHIDELRDSFPVHLQVDKTPTGSQVSVI